MRLDRHINQDGRGKYALVLLRNTNLPLKKIKTLCHEAGIPLDLGIAGTGSEFFVIRLKDRYAWRALKAYADAAREDDPEWAEEIDILWKRSMAMGLHTPD